MSQISERAVRLMKMSEDPLKWGEMIKELKRYRKVDGDCAAVLGQCYAWGMGVICDAVKCQLYFDRARDMKSGLGEALQYVPSSFAAKLLSPYLSYNLEFLLVVNDVCSKYGVPVRNSTYPPYLYFLATELHGRGERLRAQDIYKYCQSLGLHIAFMRDHLWPFHSCDTASSMLMRDPVILNPQNLPPIRFEYVHCSKIFDSRDYPPSVRLRQMKEGLPIKTLTLDCGNCNVLEVLQEGLLGIARTLKNIIIIFRYHPYAPGRSRDALPGDTCIISRLPHLTKIEFHGDYRQRHTDWLVQYLKPGASSIRKIVLHQIQEKHGVDVLGPKFIQASSQNRNLVVCGIKPDIPFLVTVNQCLTSLFPSWFPTQLKDMVISQVWCLKKHELLSSLKGKEEEGNKRKRNI